MNRRFACPACNATYRTAAARWAHVDYSHPALAAFAAAERDTEREAEREAERRAERDAENAAGGFCDD